jgi:hypothetical protein
MQDSITKPDSGRVFVKNLSLTLTGNGRFTKKGVLSKQYSD